MKRLLFVLLLLAPVWAKPLRVFEPEKNRPAYLEYCRRLRDHFFLAIPESANEAAKLIQRAQQGVDSRWDSKVGQTISEIDDTLDNLNSQMVPRNLADEHRRLSGSLELCRRSLGLLQSSRWRLKRQRDQMIQDAGKLQQAALGQSKGAIEQMRRKEPALRPL
jgi:hypothetical protein